MCLNQSPSWTSAVLCSLYFEKSKIAKGKQNTLQVCICESCL